MSKHVSKEGKNLLKNTIKHLDFQNKKIEEEWMWQMNRAKSNDDVRETNLGKKRKYDSDDSERDNLPSSSNKSKNYWMNRLVEEESKEPQRWDHNGFKELYPDEFDSDSSVESLPKKKKKKDKSKKKKKKHKKHKHKK